MCGDLSYVDLYAIPALHQMFESSSAQGCAHRHPSPTHVALHKSYNNFTKMENTVCMHLGPCADKTSNMWKSNTMRELNDFG